MTCLIVFSHLRWGFVYQRPQHLVSRLAARFQVMFVEEPVRSEGPARLERVSKGPNLEVLVPHTPVEAPGFHDDQLSVLKPLLADFLRNQGIDDYLVWFYTPMALPLMAQLRPRAVVYDCMDELAAFKDAPRQLRQRETALMKLADVMFAGGPALYESKRALHDNLHCLPSSVDAEHFRPGRLDPASEEAAAAAALQGDLAQPRLGFFGVIDERFDIELLRAVAEARPDWQIVMVGPVAKIDPARLPVLPNIRWLGIQPYPMLPYLMAGWDVCLMPFALNDSTRFISPTKTLEYLAGGKPIVSTPVPDVLKLYGEVVAVATGADEFVRACAAALAETPQTTAARLEQSMAVVRRSSWDRVAETMHQVITAQLARTPVLAPASRLEPVAVAIDPLDSRDVRVTGAVTAPAQPAPIPAAAGRLPRHVRHLVIGAGPTGLAAAYHLGKGSAGSDTLLLEREDRVGGWCRSVEDGGYTFDCALQMMCSNDPSVTELYTRLLGDNLHWQNREAWNWTPQGYSRHASPGALHGLPPKQEADAAGDAGPEPTASPLGPNARFGYPLQGGFQALMDAFLPFLKCELALETGVLHVSPSARTVRLDDGRLLAFDSLISTMPLPLLVEACGDEAPAEVRRAAQALRQVSVRRVNLGIRRDDGCGSLAGKHWISYPEGAVFHRVFVQGNASPHNNPPGGFGLSCEIGYSAAKPLPCEGPALIDRVVADCRKVGLIGPDTPVEVANQVDMPCAYVVPEPVRAGHVGVIRDWFASFGLVLAGRYSEWEYHYADHPFVAGRKAAEQAVAHLAAGVGQPLGAPAAVATVKAVGTAKAG